RVLLPAMDILPFATRALVPCLAVPMNHSHRLGPLHSSAKESAPRRTLGFYPACNDVTRRRWDVGRRLERLKHCPNPIPASSRRGVGVVDQPPTREETEDEPRRSS